MSVHILSTTSSPRLQYICQFIFTELLGINFNIDIDIEEFIAYKGPKINYTHQPLGEVAFAMPNYPLLFEQDIVSQKTKCFETKDYKAFYKINNADFDFDIFAASFYLLSRYEEYLPHQKDIYGRYAHENSIAYKENFLHLPIINIWVNYFSNALQNKFSTFKPQINSFKFLPTYDIDIAYSYKHKGLKRNVGGFIKSPSLDRIKVLLGLKKDPFDCYTWLHQLHKKNNIEGIYFFLVAEKNGKYDKNILPNKKAIWQLIKNIGIKNDVALHPSWQSSDNIKLLIREKKILQSIIEKPILKSRQHYIRFSLPNGYQQLIDAEITDDYSMGYGSINGFRASTATTFYWYNLQKDEQTSLKIHPFCFMDANSFYEQKQNTQNSFLELMEYYKICQKVNSTLIIILHNNFLGTDKTFAGWRELYENFLTQIN